MNRRNLIFCLVLAVISALATGCSNHDGNEWQRLVCEVESINASSPLVSAYLYVGSDKEAGTADDVFPVDIVPVQFYARAYSSAIVLPEDGVNSWFHVTNYDLTWLPGPNAPAELTNYNVTNAHCEALVPVNDHGLVNILIADRVMKEEDWFRDLYLIPGHSFTAACQLRFYGHETGSSNIVSMESGFMVTFYGAVDPG